MQQLSVIVGCSRGVLQRHLVVRSLFSSFFCVTAAAAFSQPIVFESALPREKKDKIQKMHRRFCDAAANTMYTQVSNGQMGDGDAEKRPCVKLRRRCCSAPCVRFLVFSALLNLGMLIGLIVLAVQKPREVAVMRSLNSEKDWIAHVRCVDSPDCDMCRRPLVLIDQPTGERPVILAERGSGGTLLRLLIEWSTRLRTGIDDCFVGHQWGNAWDLYDPPFVSECAGSFLFSHQVAVRSMSTWHYTGHPGYVPTRFLRLRRNPFDSARSAWEFEKTCGGFSSLTCVGRSATADMFSPESGWPEYAINHAKQWVAMEEEYTRRKEPKAVVYFEELRSHSRRARAMEKVLDFLRPVGYQASTERELACMSRGDAANDHDTRRSSPTDTRRVFPPELVKKFCTHVERLWSTDHWGPTCRPTATPTLSSM